MRAEAPIAARVLLQRLVERALIEVRPQAVDEMQLRVRALPQQEIAQALFAAGADQQVDFRRRQCRVIHFREALDEARAIDVVCGPHASARFDKAVLRRVVDRDAQTHAGAMRRGLLAALDQRAADPGSAGRGGR